MAAVAPNEPPARRDAHLCGRVARAPTTWGVDGILTRRCSGRPSAHVGPPHISPPQIRRCEDLAMTGKFWGLEEAPAVRDATERPRKNTIERFNEELSVLERPLEDDVEYYDEAPPSARWRKLTAFVLVAGLTVCGSLIVTHHLRARAAVAPPSPAEAPIAAPAKTAPAVAATTLAPPSPLSSSDRQRAAPPALAAAGDAPGARPEARSADADSVKATHRSRHARHRRPASHHHRRPRAT
jgi:hypothetical protein